MSTASKIINHPRLKRPLDWLCERLGIVVFAAKDWGQRDYTMSCVIECATGGRASKTNYTETVYRQLIEEHINECVEREIEDRAESNPRESE